MKNIDFSGQTTLEKFIGLLFSEGKEEVLKDLNNLQKSPKEFIKKNRPIFKSRDVDEDDFSNSELLFKTVLTYHLKLQNNFLVLDHNQSGHEGLNSVNDLLKTNRVPQISITENEDEEKRIHCKYLDDDSDNRLDTFDLLIYISKKMVNYNFTLIELNFGGDSFDVFVLPIDKVSKVIELSKKLKIDLTPMNILAFP